MCVSLLRWSHTLCPNPLGGSDVSLLTFGHVRRQRATRRALGPVAERVLALHHGVDLTRPLVDHRSLGIAKVAEDRIFVAVAISAVHFDGIRGRVEGGVTGVPLGQ